MNDSRSRARLLDWLRSQLLGPALKGAENSLLGMRPLDRYPCGALFPVIRGEAGLDAQNDDEAAEAAELAIDARKES